jgi:hypothetical protein
LNINQLVLAVVAVGSFTVDCRAAELPLAYGQTRLAPAIVYTGRPFPPCVERWGYVLHCAPRSAADVAYYNSTLPLEMTARWQHRPYRQLFTWGR